MKFVNGLVVNEANVLHQLAYLCRNCQIGLNLVVLISIPLKFFSVHQNIGMSLKCILTKFELSNLAVFKILQFKNNNFSQTLVLPFCQYCDKRLTF